MPKVTLDIDNTDLTVTRPVAQRIAYDLVSMMGLPQRTRVIMPGANSDEDLPISTIDRNTDSIYGKELKVILKAEEKFVDNRVYTDSLMQNENEPLFYDKETGVIISPNYMHTEIEIKLDFRLPDLQAARKLESDIKRNTTMFRTGRQHEVEYNYYIPKVNLVILAEIYRCKEINAPSGKTFTEWLREGLHPDVTTAANIVGENRELSKVEVQSRINGIADFSIVPEKAEQAENQRVHVLSFTYTIQYDKIATTVMSYPYMLNNTHISEKFFDNTIPYDIGRRLEAPPRMVANLDEFTNNRDIPGYVDGAPIPHYYDWYPKHTLTGMEGLFRVMVEVDKNNPRDLFNLTELGTYQIHDDLIKYMKQNYDMLDTHRMSVVNVILFENDNIKDGSALNIDADLNITTTFDMDVKKTYSVWIALLCDLNKLKRSEYEKVRKDGAFCVFLLNAIDPTLKHRGLLPTIKQDGTVRNSELRNALAAIARKNNPNTGSASYTNFRVGSFVVVAS